MAAFEFFKKPFEFKGKHAKMASELWIKNDYEHTYFKRLIDLYVVAAVVGFRVDRKADIDYSPYDAKTIFSDQMMGAKEELDFILQMIIMLDSRAHLNAEESVKKAFRGAENKEEFENYQNIFNSYVRGGVEEIYERLIVQPKEKNEFYDDKTIGIMELLERFS